MFKFVVIALIFVVLLGGLRLVIPRLGVSKARGPVTVNGTLSLADCPDSPNCQGSQSSRADQQVEPISMPGVQAPVHVIADLMASEADTTIVQQDEQYLHVTFSTAVAGFVDDVEFLHTPGSDVVQIRSASRLGKSDLGANRKRIERIRGLLSNVPRGIH